MNRIGYVLSLFALFMSGLMLTSPNNAPSASAIALLILWLVLVVVSCFRAKNAGKTWQYGLLTAIPALNILFVFSLMILPPAE